MIRTKRLFRHFGVSGNPLERSRTRKLECSFAETIGSDHAIPVNSGTSALVCGLVGTGVGPGGERWRGPRRMYEATAQGWAATPELPFFDRARGTWEQSVAVGP